MKCYVLYSYFVLNIEEQACTASLKNKILAFLQIHRVGENM